MKRASFCPALLLSGVLDALLRAWCTACMLQGMHVHGQGRHGVAGHQESAQSVHEASCMLLCAPGPSPPPPRLSALLHHLNLFTPLPHPHLSSPLPHPVRHNPPPHVQVQERWVGGRRPTDGGPSSLLQDPCIRLAMQRLGAAPPP